MLSTRALGPGLLLASLAVGCKTDGAASGVKDDGVLPFAEQTGDDDGPFDEADAKQIGNRFQQVTPLTPRAKRPVFQKMHGCAKATFTVPADLPEALRQGLFATPGEHTAWVRWSTDGSTGPDTVENTYGFAVKVLGVPGPKLLAGEETATTHDFLLQSSRVFFSDTAHDFMEFIEAAFHGQQAEEAYLAAHPRTKELLDAVRSRIDTVLTTTYWSTMPYRFGAQAYAKYKVVPCAEPGPVQPPVPDTDPNYLGLRLQKQLKAKDGCYDFQVQLRKPGMPLDQATVEWSEQESAPQTVARITLPAQDVKANVQTCDDFSFTPWHALAEHRPVGSVSKARGIIYKRIADLRRTKNGVPIQEPQ